MLKYSHVALKIVLEEPTGRAVTDHLGCQPSQIQKHTIRSGKPGAKLIVLPKYFWRLDSPKDETFQPIVRLDALLAVIAPFSDKLISLDSKYRRMIDIVLHTTAQRADGRITGEFDWFTMAPCVSSRLGAWNLPFSYETFWFDHPERKK